MHPNTMGSDNRRYVNHFVRYNSHGVRYLTLSRFPLIIALPPCKRCTGMAATAFHAVFTRLFGRFEGCLYHGLIIRIRLGVHQNRAVVRRDNAGLKKTRGSGCSVELRQVDGLPYRQ